MLDPTWLDHLLAVLWGVALPAWTLAGARRGFGDAKFDFAAKVGMYWGNSAFLWIMAGSVIGAWLWAGRPLAQLGLRPPLPGAALPATLLTVAFVLWYAGDTLSKVGSPERLEATRERWRRLTPFMPATGREVVHSLVLVASAAVAEEIVFRGFLIFYLFGLAGGSPAGLALAVGAPAAVFGLSHLYQGRGAVLRIVVLAVGFGLLFVLTGSLWLPIALHFLVDLAGSLLGTRLLEPEPESGPVGE